MEQHQYWRFCVTGNIVRKHKGGNGETYYSTREFSGGTKVYIDGNDWFYHDNPCLYVIGLNRHKRYVLASVEPFLIENVRFQIIHRRGVLRFIEHIEHLEGWDFWGKTALDKRGARVFADNWDKVLGMARMRKKRASQL